MWKCGIRLEEFNKPYKATSSTDKSLASIQIFPSQIQIISGIYYKMSVVLTLGIVFKNRCSNIIPVACNVRMSAAKLEVTKLTNLRCHPVWSSDHRLPFLISYNIGTKAKVSNFHTAIHTKQDIIRFDVSMNYTLKI